MRRLVTAGIRIVIVFAFLQVLYFIANDIFSILNDFSNRIFPNLLFFITSGLSIVFLVILLILCLIWWRAGSIAAFLAGSDNDNQLVINTSNTDFIKVLIRVLGICLIFFTLPIIFGQLTYYLTHRGMMNENDLFYQMWWVTDMARILIGLWLTLGGRGIVTAINKIWDAASMTSNRDDKKNADAPKNIVNRDTKN